MLKIIPSPPFQDLSFLVVARGESRKLIAELSRRRLTLVRVGLACPALQLHPS